MELIRRLWQKYRELIMYGVVGVCTTVINVVAFQLLHTGGMHYAIANVIAWVVAVAFSFFANKLLVFENHGWKPQVVWREAVTFTLSRAATLLVDEAGMALLISGLHWQELPAKVVVNVLVIIINYVLGKFWVFGGKNAPTAKED